MKYTIEKNITHQNESKVMKIEICAVDVTIRLEDAILLYTSDIDNMQLLFSEALDIFKKFNNKKQLEEKQ